jgi:hypothetical protein
MTLYPAYRLLASAWVASVLFAAAGHAQTPPPAAVAIPPILAGEARIWFYRDLAPYESLSETYIRLNGAAVGVSQAGGSFYRDVPPGHYHISADSYLDDPNQTRDVDLAAGQEIYAKVLPSDPWIQGGGGGGRGGGGGGYHRDTFFVWLYPAETARPVIAQSWFYGGGAVTPARPPS